MEIERVEKDEKMNSRLSEKVDTIEMRLAENENREALKEIWALCFGDPEPYTDLYFNTRDWVHETAVLLINGKPVSMLAMIPVCMVAVNGIVQKASMIFAVATHPEYRKLGYADQLLEFSNRHLVENQTNISLLVPAEEHLFQFYGKRGYKDFFSIREIKLKYSDLACKENESEKTSSAKDNCLPDDDFDAVEICPAEPEEYNRIRKNQLAGQTWLEYREEEILFEKRTAMMFGTDIYKVNFSNQKINAYAASAGTSDPVGCFYAERASEDLIVIKELLVPDEAQPAVLRRIAKLFPANEYIIRMPADWGSAFGGEIKPFGMVRINKADGSSVEYDAGPEESGAYLGIAYD